MLLRIKFCLVPRILNQLRMCLTLTIRSDIQSRTVPFGVKNARVQTRSSANIDELPRSSPLFYSVLCSVTRHCSCVWCRAAGVDLASHNIARSVLFWLREYKSEYPSVWQKMSYCTLFYSGSFGSVVYDLWNTIHLHLISLSDESAAYSTGFSWRRWICRVWQVRI